MDSLTQHFPTLGFLGAGNMAGALLRGTVGRGLLAPGSVWTCDIDPARREDLARELGVHATGDASELARRTRTIVLAVKPQVVPEALDALRGHVGGDHLLISIAAGIPTDALAARLGDAVRWMRVMPNTPALVGAGAAAVARGPRATDADAAAALALMEAVGLAVEVDERDLDAVTALSGSGPAYVFRVMEILTETAVEMGLEADVARRLTLQTVLGAARLAAESDETPKELRRRVTSPGGTTEAALAVFAERGLDNVLRAGLLRARDRSRELARASNEA